MGIELQENETNFASVSTETNIGKDMFIERFTKRSRRREKEDEKRRKRQRAT